MNLAEINFPKVNFLTVCSEKHWGFFEKLLAEAHSYKLNSEDNPYFQLARRLVENGGQVTFKTELPDEFVIPVYSYFLAVRKSKIPGFYDKLAVCALLLSEVANDSMIQPFL